MFVSCSHVVAHVGPRDPAALGIDWPRPLHYFGSGHTIPIISYWLGDRLPPIDFPLSIVAIPVTVKCLFKQLYIMYIILSLCITSYGGAEWKFIFVIKCAVSIFIDLLLFFYWFIIVLCINLFSFDCFLFGKPFTIHNHGTACERICIFV